MDTERRNELHHRQHSISCEKVQLQKKDVKIRSVDVEKRAGTAKLAANV